MNFRQTANLILSANAATQLAVVAARKFHDSSKF